MMRWFLVALAWLALATPALSAPAPPAQEAALPKTLTVYFSEFTGLPYGAITPENIRKTAWKFVVTSHQDIRDLYRLLGDEARAERYEADSTRLRVDDANGAALFLVDMNGVVRAGGHEYALGSNDFLRLDQTLNDLLTQDRRHHKPLPIPKPPKESPLIEAVWTHNLPRVKALLARGVPADTRGSEGFTALADAVMDKRTAMAALLLAHGANPNARQPSGQPALTWAAEHGDAATARLLLSHGAAVNVKDAEGHTALYGASLAGSVATARLLLDRKAHVDLTDPGALTPLMAAAWKGHAEVVRLLLARGADPNIQDGSRNTALTLAQEGGHQEIIELLQKAGGH